MKAAFGVVEDAVGLALLPVLERFSNWVASPEGQQKMQDLITLLTGLAGKFEMVAGFVIDNADAFITISGVLVTAGIAFKVFTGVMTIYNGVATITAARNAAIAASQVAVGTTAAAASIKVTALATALRLVSAIVGTAALVLMLGGDSQKQEPRVPIPQVPNSPMLTPAPTPKKTGFDFNSGTVVNNNVTINTPKVTAQDIVKTWNNSTRNGYTGTFRDIPITR